MTFSLGRLALLTLVLAAASISARAAVPVDAAYLDAIPGIFSGTARTEALQSYQDFSQGPFSASIHGIFREIARFHSIDASYDDVSIPTRHLTNGALTVQLHVAREENGRIRRAPLAIVLNPLFGEKLFFQMSRFIQFFGERGFHVVVVQNTFGDTVTTKAPDFFPGDVRAEADMHRDVIESVIRRIGGENVSGSTLVGLSYGAFLASVIKAGDAASPVPRINGPVLLVNPPYDLLNSMRNLDRFVDESEAEGGKFCLLSLDFPRLLLNGFFVDDTQHVRINEKCAKAFLTIFGFQGRLHHALSELSRSKELNLTSSRIDDMNFESYLNDLARVRIEPGMSELNYWIRAAQAHDYDSFLVVGSSDDPINEHFVASQSQSGPIDATHLLEVPTGGHTGLRSANSRDPGCQGGNWFSCLLEKIYPQAPGSNSQSTDALSGGACTNNPDAGVSKATMEAREILCARKCLGGSSCTSQCMVEALGLTAGCSSCWGQAAECGKHYCALPCGISPNSSSCRGCTTSHGCDAAFTTCAGI